MALARTEPALSTTAHSVPCWEPVAWSASTSYQDLVWNRWATSQQILLLNCSSPINYHFIRHMNFSLDPKAFCYSHTYISSLALLFKALPPFWPTLLLPRRCHPHPRRMSIAGEYQMPLAAPSLSWRLSAGYPAGRPRFHLKAVQIQSQIQSRWVKVGNRAFHEGTEVWLRSFLPAHSSPLRKVWGNWAFSATARRSKRGTISDCYWFCFAF